MRYIFYIIIAERRICRLLIFSLLLRVKLKWRLYMKKRLSIFLIFVLLFSLSSTTVASALPNKSELPGLYAAEDGDMFILQSEDRDATIITNDTHHSMTVSIKYSHNPDTVYQWYISDYPMPFEPSSSAFWTDIIAYAEDHISQAEEIIFVSNTPSEMHNSIQFCGSRYLSATREVRWHIAL